MCMEAQAPLRPSGHHAVTVHMTCVLVSELHSEAVPLLLELECGKLAFTCKDGRERLFVLDFGRAESR